jgi:hypothetical protein
MSFPQQPVPVAAPVVPVVPDFIARQVDAEGEAWNSHKGLFAIAAIPKGTRIINEKPVALLQACHIRGKDQSDMAAELFRQFQSLPQEHQDYIVCLRPAAVAELYSFVIYIDSILE